MANFDPIKHRDSMNAVERRRYDALIRRNRKSRESKQKVNETKSIDPMGFIALGLWCMFVGLMFSSFGACHH